MFWKKTTSPEREGRGEVASRASTKPSSRTSPRSASADENNAELPAVFDGHNDTLLRLHMAGKDVTPFFEGRERGHVDLPKARRGGFGGGLFAIFVPTPTDEALLDLATDDGVDSAQTQSDGASGQDRSLNAEAPKQVARAKKPVAFNRDHIPYSDPVGLDTSVRVAEEVLDLAKSLVARSGGQVIWMKTLDDLRSARADFDGDAFFQNRRAGVSEPALSPLTGPPSAAEAAPIRMVVHFEGAEPVAPDLSNLDHWYEQGVRSIGLVWSRRNAFAAGVPFRYPSTPDHYEGLSKAGVGLVERCDDLGILLDLAHLNEKGFWDVERVSRKPLVVTHSGALSVCPSSRNLTDDQIRAVKDTDGVIGINLHCGDLRPDGRLNSDTPVEVVARHIDVVLEIAGPRHVALGSDFDGALMPRFLSDASCLPALLEHLQSRGWSEQDLRRFAYGNWIRALHSAWSA